MTTYCETLVQNYRATRIRIEAAGLLAAKQEAAKARTEHMRRLREEQERHARQEVFRQSAIAMRSYPERLIQAWADHYGVTVAQLKDFTRKDKFVKARQAVFFELYVATEFSLPQIGEDFNRDHTTILWGIKAHCKRLGFTYPPKRIGDVS